MIRATTAAQDGRLASGITTTEGIGMASDESFVEFVVDQMGDAGHVSYRKMFGEYAIYCHGRVVALVCDNQLFVKQTEGGRSYLGSIVEAAPYPGAKLHFLIGDTFEDREWISGLIKITAEELPAPKPKRSRKKPGK
jgi:TfoX/Sxy family transcriptional regulator of competence genes